MNNTTTNTATVDTTANPTVSAPKKRGRPKGSKNKPKLPQTQTTKE